MHVFGNGLFAGLLTGLLFISALGCGGRNALPSQAEAAEPAFWLTVETPAPTPAPAPTEPAAEPDMVFEEDGDIYFSQAYQAQFIPGIVSFDHPPRVLIYHTHARESFREEPTAVLSSPAPVRRKAGVSPSPAPTAPTRSLDPAKSVIRLGDLLAEALSARGFSVIHDRTDVEDPALSTAYARSRTVMEQYEGIDLYIDLHRNAADPQRSQNDVVMLNGQRTARLFFVVGTGLTADSSAGEFPGWRQNYTLALSLYERLRAVDEGLAKPNRVKQKVYNQDLGLSLLCEIGHNANLLADAAHTVPYLADALAQVIRF